ncbi:MAG: histone deacetylase [Acidimicrobiia bacterium]
MSRVGRVAVVSTRALDRHDTGPRHPESSSRLAAVEQGVHRARLGDDLVELEPRTATRAELERAHDPEYLDALESFLRSGGGALDRDTRASPGSWATAGLAAGAGLVALEALRAGDADAAFVCVRPPGHHASRARAMGFCLLNSIAVAVASLRAGGERVLVVDWDAHHGNGTETNFWDDPGVTYVSTHQWGHSFFPGTGAPSDTGGPGAPGSVWNFALPAGATADAARAALDVVAPAVEVFDPTWVLVSCGFDAHRADPLAGLAWSAGDYAHLTQRVSAFAPRAGRLALFLEGGYDLDALERCTAVTLAALAGGATADVDGYETPTSGGPGRDAITRTADAHARLA